MCMYMCIMYICIFVYVYMGICVYVYMGMYICIYHNQHAGNTSYTRSNINTINRQEEQPKNLKHASIQQNEGGNSDQILAELIHEMQQVIMATENLKKRFDEMLKRS